MTNIIRVISLINIADLSDDDGSIYIGRVLAENIFLPPVSSPLNGLVGHGRSTAGRRGTV